MNSQAQAGDQKGNLMKQEINDLINQDRVVIFSKESCPYCDDAKNVSVFVPDSLCAFLFQIKQCNIV